MGFLIDMINVGEGDAFLLTLDGPAGEATVLVDGGPPSRGRTVADYVHRYAGGSLDMAIGTHLDLDHIGGLKDVVERCVVRQFMLNVPGSSRRGIKEALYRHFAAGARGSGSREYLEKSMAAARDLADAIESQGLVVQPILQGGTWRRGDCVLRVLNPSQERLDAAWAAAEGAEAGSASLFEELRKALAPATSAENDSSVVVELEYKGQPYGLMCSDAGAAVLREVTQGRRYEFLKVPHHGSQTGMDEALVAQLQAKTAYVPVGDNPYGHPATEVLEMLRTNGAKTYCSERTKHCRRECPAKGFGNLSHKHDREFRAGFSSVDPAKCANNR